MRGLAFGVGVGAGLLGGGSCFPPVTGFSMPILLIELMTDWAVENADIILDGVRVT